MSELSATAYTAEEKEKFEKDGYRVVSMAEWIGTPGSFVYFMKKTVEDDADTDEDDQE